MAVVGVMGIVGASQGIVVTFDDLAFGQTYPVPGSFVTQGTQVQLTPYVHPDQTVMTGGTATVQNGAPLNWLGGSLLQVWTDAQYVLPAAATGGSLQWAVPASGTEGRLVINGQPMWFASSPMDLNGQTLAGVTLLSIPGPTVSSANTGVLFLIGNFNTVAFGGMVMSVDNVIISTNVPEPATMALLALGGVLLIRRKGA